FEPPSRLNGAGGGREGPARGDAPRSSHREAAWKVDVRDDLTRVRNVEVRTPRSGWQRISVLLISRCPSPARVEQARADLQVEHRAHSAHEQVDAARVAIPVARKPGPVRINGQTAVPLFIELYARKQRAIRLAVLEPRHRMDRRHRRQPGR